MRKKDPGTAREWEAYARRKALRREGKNNALGDMDTEATDNQVEDHDDKLKGEYDWSDD